MTALVTLCCTAGLFGTAGLNPLRAALGSAYTEAPGHLWGLWTTAKGLLSWGPWVRHADLGFPYTFDAHLMDPINLLFFLPFYALGGGGATGATLGWNALHAGSVLVGGYGCWRLAERLFQGHPGLRWIGAVMAAVFCGNSYLMFVPYMGRTEFLPAVFYPLHLALLHDWMRVPPGLEGGPRTEAPPLKVGVWAGLTLGAAALGGSYLSVFLALAEIPAALWLARGLPLRESAWRLALVAGIGGLCVAPAVWALLAFPPDHGSILDTSREKITASNFPYDALPTLFRIRPHGDDGRWMEVPAYVGVVSLGLGIFAAAARPRLAAAWLLITLWLLSFAPGPFLIWDPLDVQRLGDDALRPLTGYYLLSAAPPLMAMRAWSRISGLVAVPAALVAGMGIAALTARMNARQTSVFGFSAVLLVLLDQGTYPKRYSPVRPWFDVHAPQALLDAVESLPPGALLELPIDIPLRRGGGPEIKGTYWLWQLEHGRPISATPRSVYDMAVLDSAIARHAVELEFLSVDARGGSLDPSAPPRNRLPTLKESEVRCARADAVRLHEQGFAAIVLHTDRAGASELDDMLGDLLGEPTVDTPPVLAWDLEKYAATAQVDDDGCSLPRLPESLRRKVDPMLRSLGR